jgi:hypothetical protein
MVPIFLSGFGNIVELHTGRVLFVATSLPGIQQID